MKTTVSIVGCAVLALPLAMSAATISGRVTDRTTNLPARGDTAVLLDLTQTMQESARAEIDRTGHFSFTVPGLTAMRVIRVEHEKTDYYAAVPPNTPTVDLDVYDVAEHVAGVHVYADVSRVQADTQQLRVTESFTVRNDSKPPMTQFSAHAFEFNLPPTAVLEDGAATGPGGMTIRNMPVPLQDQNHYAFVFPLRPGENHLQVSYRLPYNGSFVFHPAVSTPTDNLAVTLPTAMRFSGPAFQPFHGDSDQPGTQTYLATAVQAGNPLLYTVSGSGNLPPLPQNNALRSPGMGRPTAPGNSTVTDTEPAAGSSDALSKYVWWIVSIVGLALVIVTAFMLRSRTRLRSVSAADSPLPARQPAPPSSRAVNQPAESMVQKPAAEERRSPLPVRPETLPAVPSSIAPPPLTQANPTLLDLKEELFAVETERLKGNISEEDSRQIKAALETLMRRALARGTTAE